MKTNKKWMLLIAVVMLFAFAAVAVAGPAAQKISASLDSSVKFNVNGNAWTPKAANGTTLTPIMYNGSLYLPVRAIGDALGVKVDWKADTRTVILGENAAPKEEPKKEEVKKEEPKKEEVKKEEVKKEEPKKEEVKKEEPKPAAANPADVVKAAIAAFKPAKATFTINAVVKGTSVGDLNVKVNGTGAVDDSKKVSSKWSGDLGALGTSNPTGAFCPFSELVAGPEADALNIVNGGKISQEGEFTVITVSGVAIPPSFKSVLDNTSQMVKVAFNLKMDAKIKINKAGQVVEITVTAMNGTGNALGKDMASQGTGSVTYTY